MAQLVETIERSRAATIPVAGTKTVAVTTVSEVVGAATVTFTSITFAPYKAARTINTGTVWVQHLVADASLGLPLVAVAGTTLKYEAPPGTYFNLAQFFLDVETAADGVTYVYF